MSVFADFQRMWLKRFPDNSLSTEWEDDVRVSLQRHKQKVVDLSKDLEQEMLYVEYLERLLSDVEEFRKAGGDPSIPIQKTNNDDDDVTNSSIDKEVEKSDESTTNDEHTSTSINGNGGEKSVVTDSESSEFQNSMAAIRSKVEKMNQSREQGTLHHHQCIDKLTLHLRNTQLKNTTADETKLTSPTRSETPTSFVTVIEVKDPSPIPAAITTSQTTTSISISDRKDEQPEIKEENQTFATEKTEERNTSPVQNVEIRRKIPPRPPPKVARRVGPIADGPTTIVETPASPSNLPTRSSSVCSSDSNVRPSEFLRHKHSDERHSSILLKNPQHNITKSAQNSSSESLINNTTNDETLHVESFPISERIKSYESISSLSSDGLKAAAAAANNSSMNSSHGNNEHDNSGCRISHPKIA